MPQKRDTASTSESENPAIPAPTPKRTRPRTNKDWWPNQLDLSVLHAHSPRGNPLGPSFDYARAFARLDVEALRQDLVHLMTDPQPWWPPDFGHYGPFFIRMSWHAAGTYRTADGRGGGGSGQQRFAPLDAWPDNANLDKARRLLWPIKQKYGQAVSWADLLVFAGNVALESMGFKTFGFGFGREDTWEPEEIFWGPEDAWLGDERYAGDRQLAGPLAAVQMGLIYVNPEGPGGQPDVQAAARDIEETFRRMAMDDVETAALIVGGHTFGKAHGAHKADRLGPDPEAAPLEAQGLGWANPHGTGHGADTVTAGPEGSWTSRPTEWTHEFLQNLYGHEWELTTSPAGTKQWRPKGGVSKVRVPDAHVEGRHHPPMMFTTDLAMRLGPRYAPITTRWLDHPEELADAFAKAWYKLLHRDMGPVSRYLGPWVAPPQLWQDPVPPATHAPIGDTDAQELKRQILAAGVPLADLVSAAWAAAATFRGTDKRGGANGGRVRLDPQRGWAVNEPERLAKTVAALERIQAGFSRGDRHVSFADLVVLAGNAAVERAAKNAGHDVVVPFTPGRTDATQDMTDAASFAVLEPVADGFRNHLRPGLALSPETLLLERANLLTLTAPQMTVLVGGLRVLGANHGGSRHGVFTDKKDTLTNDFFVHLLDMGTQWRKVGENEYEGTDRATGRRRWTATAVDLVFGAHSQLRALCEVYAAADGERRFVDDFVAAWAKVGNLDRYDVKGRDGRPLAAAR